MRRKVIQIAGKTLLISLPSKWAKQTGIIKGQELEVTPKGSTLLVSTTAPGQPKTISVDCADASVGVNRLMGALYKAGYDDIQIRFRTQQQYTDIKRCLDKTCEGLQIVEQNQRTLRIRSTSRLSEEHYDAVLRRLLHAIVSMVDDAIKYALVGDVHGLAEMELRDEDINRLADFCRRMLNTTGNLSRLESNNQYHIVEQIERVGDQVKELGRSRTHLRLDSKKERLLDRIPVYTRAFESLFVEFSMAKFESFLEEGRRLRDLLVEWMQASPKDAMSISPLLGIVTTLRECNGSVLVRDVAAERTQPIHP
ncbi:MAG: hypothetical protein ABIH41_00850 [Nanoarchaeota archaeon]